MHGPHGDDSGEVDEEGQMPFMEHLEELRTRLIRCFYPFLPAFFLAWAFRAELMAVLSQPLATAWQELGMTQPELHFANPVDPIVVYLKISAVIALLASSPWVFYQLWCFIGPGLYKSEKRLALPFVFESTLFFTIGSLFGWFFVFPPAFKTLLEFAGELPGQQLTITPTLMITEYTSFISRMLLTFGLVFEVPVVITFLAMAEIVDWRQLLSFGRWWLVVSAVLSALLTPQDVLSMVLMMVPLVVLYYLSVAFAFFLGRKKQRERAEQDD